MTTTKHNRQPSATIDNNSQPPRYAPSPGTPGLKSHVPIFSGGNARNTPSRNKLGHWLPGHSGHPQGRPIGARDKRPRKRPHFTHDLAANLGLYRYYGGPGCRYKIGGRLGRIVAFAILMGQVTRNPERIPVDREEEAFKASMRLAEGLNIAH